MVATFTVIGTPRGKQRARTVRKGPRVMTFTPLTTRQYEQAIGLCATAARPEGWPMDARYALTVLVYGARANTDLSNVVKATEDACNSVLYEDDKQIDHLVARRFADKAHPRIEVTCEVLT